MQIDAQPIKRQKRTAKMHKRTTSGQYADKHKQPERNANQLKRYKMNAD